MVVVAERRVGCPTSGLAGSSAPQRKPAPEKPEVAGGQPLARTTGAKDNADESALLRGQPGDSAEQDQGRICRALVTLIFQQTIQYMAEPRSDPRAKGESEGKDSRRSNRGVVR